ncbi:DUF6449 domain-containing protein [Paenibacillus tepidiphilus]|uniref:DUF6449 domain-containing protein n=1 Tax=Paenibacillus tepidiphilus TaxID=2608683 RepID=UPI0012399BAC|nr:DUF6449 domain-containing protein [Paenibacillus tepidiphilus]
MTRSRFFFNGGIFRQNMRQHGWIGIMYTLGLLFAVPLQMLLSGSDERPPLEIDSLFDIAGNVQMLFILTLPVAAALFQFRYLQSKQPSDLWHSLPLRRERLLAGHMLSGGLLLLVPVWLTSVLAALLHSLDSNAFLYQAADVWIWCLSVSVITVFFYLFGVFVGICTGQTVLQGIVIYILLLLPAVLLLLINLHLNMYLYGYSDNFSRMGMIENWSPVYKLMDITVEPFSMTEIGIYAALSVVFGALSFVLYRKRQAEKTGYALAFTYFNPLFKAGVMLCAMLISGTYFASVQARQPGWVITGYVLGALIGYIAAEMIIRKSWHILTRRVPLEFALYAGLLGLAIWFPISDWNGYENRVPQSAKIEGVYIGDNYQMFGSDMAGEDRQFADEQALSQDKNYIEAVRKLHQAIVTARPGDGDNDRAQYYGTGSHYFNLAYKLESGRELLRTYWLPDAGFEAELKAVMEHEEFKRKQYRVFALNDEVESFRIGNGEKFIRISEPGEVAEFMDILRREILAMSYEDQTGGQIPRATIQTVPKPGVQSQIYYNFTYEWVESYHELDRWLEQKGYADKVRTLPQEVKSVEIFQDNYPGKLSSEQLYNLDVHLQLARSEKRTSITTDKTVIADILDHRRNYQGTNGAYVVIMEYTNGRSEYVSVEEKDATPAIKALLPLK